MKSVGVSVTVIAVFFRLINCRSNKSQVMPSSIDCVVSQFEKDVYCNSRFVYKNSFIAHDLIDVKGFDKM